MKIVVLEGSPNKKGSSNLLANEFIREAEETGHTAEIIDAAHAALHPCIGCVRCGYEGPCVQKDDMELGYGCGTMSMTRHSEYPDKAYWLGRGL